MAIFQVKLGEELPEPCRQGALTIGNFDGVHRGHQALLAELGRQAKRCSGPAVALTFDPHPLQLLRPETFQPVLTIIDDRAELLQQSGADHVVVLQTTPDLLRLSADEFFSKIVREDLQAKGMVEGFNFCFGRDRQGTTETLRLLCRQAGMAFQVVPPQELNGRPISSSRVRSTLVAGSVRESTELLGRSYALRGKVRVGQRRGQTIGFPTANLEEIASLIPADGVYAVRVTLSDGDWPGAANIGPNPTFGEQERKVEIHLIGYHGDLYGQSIQVHFLDHLRGTRPFPGVEALIDQLRKDVEQSQNAYDDWNNHQASSTPERGASAP